MDLINFVLAIVLIIISLQAGQTWVVFALIVLSVLTFKSLKIAIGLVVAGIVVYFGFAQGDLFENFPLIIVGLLIVALILGIGKKPEEQQDLFPADPGLGYNDSFGGGFH